MARLFSLVLSLMVAALVLGATSCKRPVPPTLVPVEVKVVGVTGTGIDLLVKVEATNTNPYTLAARDVRAKLTMDDGRYDLGSTMITKPVTLPPNVPTPIDVPISMRWQSFGMVGEMAASGRDIPYMVEGTVKIGGENVNLDVPFTAKGVVKREQVIAAALRALPVQPGAPMLH